MEIVSIYANRFVTFIFEILATSFCLDAQKKYIWILLILLLSIALWIFYSSLIDFSGLGSSGLGDQHFYFSTALSIRESGRCSYNGIDTFYRPPLYSYFISLFYIIHDNTWGHNVLFAQSVLTYAAFGYFLLLFGELFLLKPGSPG